MTIEQTLMRLMKSSGWLTHGRGISDSVLMKWTQNMSAVNEVCQSLEDFCDLSMIFSEQHVELRSLRISRDNSDILQLTNWLSLYYPFPGCKVIMSIVSGLIGNDSINCHKTVKIGKIAMDSIVGKHFSDVSLKRNNRVLTLASLNSSIKVYNEVVPIDPLLLFQRISFTKKSDEELRDYLKYELAPYPLSIFNEEI